MTNFRKWTSRMPPDFIYIEEVPVLRMSQGKRELGGNIKRLKDKSV